MIVAGHFVRRDVKGQEFVSVCVPLVLEKENPKYRELIAQ